jgi:hypothetical protein
MPTAASTLEQICKTVQISFKKHGKDYPVFNFALLHVV